MTPLLFAFLRLPSPFTREPVKLPLHTGKRSPMSKKRVSVGAGSRVLIAGGTGLKGDGWNNLGLLIRVPNP